MKSITISGKEYNVRQLPSERFLVDLGFARPDANNVEELQKIAESLVKSTGRSVSTA